MRSLHCVDASTRYLAMLATLLGVFSPGASLVLSQEFRVETEVYVGESAEPISRAVTLFEKTTVYHFVDRPSEVAVYRRNGTQVDGQFILLDLEKQQRTEVPLTKLEKLVEKLTEWSAQQPKEELKFAAHPDFEQTFDESNGSLTLSHKLWTYRTAVIPAETAAYLLRYRDFTDAYARLNCIVHNEPPPGPRLALNNALAERGLVPIEIRRELPGEKEAARSVQLFSWRLSREDRERLDDAREKIASFSKVDNATWRK